MKPTLGRIVHYCPDMHTKDGTVRAAIISRVDGKPALPPDEKYDGEENMYFVDLHVLTPWGTDIVKNVPFNNRGPELPRTVGTWFWPERV